MLPESATSFKLLKKKLKELQAQVVVLSEKIKICSTLAVYPGCLDEIFQNGDLPSRGWVKLE